MPSCAAFVSVPLPGSVRISKPFAAVDMPMPLQRAPIASIQVREPWPSRKLTRPSGSIFDDWIFMNEKAFRSNSVEVEFQDLAAQVSVAKFLLDAGNRYGIPLE